MIECFILALYMTEVYGADCANGVAHLNDWDMTDVEATFAPNIGTVTKDFTSLFTKIDNSATCSFTTSYLLCSTSSSDFQDAN